MAEQQAKKKEAKLKALSQGKQKAAKVQALKKRKELEQSEPGLNAAPASPALKKSRKISSQANASSKSIIKPQSNSVKRTRAPVSSNLPTKKPSRTPELSHKAVPKVLLLLLLQVPVSLLQV